MQSKTCKAISKKCKLNPPFPLLLVQSLFPGRKLLLRCWQDYEQQKNNLPEIKMGRNQLIESN